VVEMRVATEQVEPAVVVGVERGRQPVTRGSGVEVV
jgi:hypothetical protein